MNLKNRIPSIFFVFFCFLFLVLQTVNTYAEPIGAETAQKLKTLRTQMRSWQPKCADGTITDHECPFGDALEYMGMLCLSGDEEMCQHVKNAQSADGRFWRSPGLVGLPDPDQGATFSNDMSMGAWAYIIAKKDKDAALRWIHYIEGNNYKLCEKSKYHFDSCATRAMFWTFATQVFDYLGLPHTKKMKGYKFWIDAIYSPLEARFQPVGYMMLLTAEKVYMIQEMIKRGARPRNVKTYAKIGKIIHKREPENPVYDYLVTGQSESAAQKILKYCPKDKPQVPVDQYGPVYVEEFGAPMTSKDYERAGGHFCIFMINTLLGSVN